MIVSITTVKAVTGFSWSVRVRAIPACKDSTWPNADWYSTSCLIIQTYALSYGSHCSWWWLDGEWVDRTICK